MGKDLPKQLHRPVGRLTILDRQIVRARRDLRALWRAASPADRLFSVERLLQETALPPEIARQLHDVQDAVRDAWAMARVAARFKHSVPADVALASLQLSLIERDRDNFLEERGLFDKLCVAAESFLRAAPTMQGAVSFRTLLRERELARTQLVPILPPIEDDARA